MKAEHPMNSRRNCQYPGAFIVRDASTMQDVWDEEAVSGPSETRKVEREQGNAGYLAGITRSKEQSLQPGFDEGYQEGAEIGLRAGRIVGAFQAKGLTDLETAALKELSPKELFSYQYYDRNTRPTFQGSDHPLLLKWENRLATFVNNE